MCGRYNMITDAHVLIDLLAIDQLLVEPDQLQPRYNIAPGQDVAIVRSTPQGRTLSMARWGLVPHWSEAATVKYSTINARAETVAEKPTYRDAFKRKRCLIPATGFYEWRQADGQKTPYHIRLPDRDVFAFAGLWDHWERGGKGFDSCSIIVTAANNAMQPIHERMPVILEASFYNVWLNPTHEHRAQLQALLVPYRGKLTVHPVSCRVNNPQNDDPACIEPAGSGVAPR
jgi:putative SOS response-associated peptidase YedK